LFRRKEAGRVAVTRRIGADALDPRIKSLNYLNHILARMEATNAGADEAILLNARGHVAEGSADNVFIVRDGRLLTPRCPMARWKASRARPCWR
jgi:branched-chain amino acid aminotransferase